jgi:hypothetical protein
VLKYSFLSALGRRCICDEPLVCRCPSTSGSASSMTDMTDVTSATSLKLLNDILLGHHATRTRISVFHADLQTIQRSLELHAIPCARLNLVQCRRIFLHHIASGACVDHSVDSSVSPRPDHSACRALSPDFKSRYVKSRVEHSPLHRQ